MTLKQCPSLETEPFKSRLTKDCMKKETTKHKQTMFLGPEANWPFLR